MRTLLGLAAATLVLFTTGGIARADLLAASKAGVPLAWRLYQAREIGR